MQGSGDGILFCYMAFVIVHSQCQFRKERELASLWEFYAIPFTNKAITLICHILLFSLIEKTKIVELSRRDCKGKKGSL